MNVCLLMMLIMCGPKIRFIIHLIFLIWTILQCSELCDSILQENPHTPGVAALKLIADIFLKRNLEIVEFKNHLELIIALFCLPLCIVGQTAPIFPIFYS